MILYSMDLVTVGLLVGGQEEPTKVKKIKDEWSKQQMCMHWKEQKNWLKWCVIFGSMEVHVQLQKMWTNLVQLTRMTIKSCSATWMKRSGFGGMQTTDIQCTKSVHCTSSVGLTHTIHSWRISNLKTLLSRSNERSCVPMHDIQAAYDL